MVADVDISRGLRKILAGADLNTTTERSVRIQLEQSLGGVDLSDKKAFIRQEVEKYLKARQDADEDDDDDDDEPQPAKKRRRKMKEDKKGKKVRKKREGGGGGGLTKICNLSPELAAIVVKSVWDYIKANNLQNQENKRQILCDTTLRSLFGVEHTDMLQMNKLLSQHIFTIDDGKPKPKKPLNPGAGRGSAFSAPLQLSEPLVEFIGTGETHLSRSEIVKRLWAHIKENNLQDPSDKRKILSDEKLKKLFGVDEFVGFSMTKLLVPHFIKAEPTEEEEVAIAPLDLNEHEGGIDHDDGEEGADEL
eukprot:SM000005S17342  [mRNA]  locus=s5:1489082:1490959:- [translate_table: standard]